ncbi:MAG: glycosyltransferase [Microthrixaceae bacterium]
MVTHARPDATLALVGHHPRPAFAAKVEAFAASLGLSDRAWITGGLPDTHLAELYRAADVVATASRHEGLCIPVLEAMAMSVPVVVADHGALAETVGDGGLVVGSDSAPAFAEAIGMALDPRHRAELVLRGRRQAAARSLEAALGPLTETIAEWYERR